jgi:hypothetical protein
MNTACPGSSSAADFPVSCEKNRRHPLQNSNLKPQTTHEAYPIPIALKPANLQTNTQVGIFDCIAHGRWCTDSCKTAIYTGIDIPAWLQFDQILA